MTRLKPIEAGERMEIHALEISRVIEFEEVGWPVVYMYTVKTGSNQGLNSVRTIDGARKAKCRPPTKEKGGLSKGKVGGGTFTLRSFAGAPSVVRP